MTGVVYKTSNFLLKTFEREEIFYNDSNVQLDGFNNTNFDIEEIRSIFNGRCYMVCKKEKLKRKNWFYIPFQKKIDLRVFVHDREDMMWIGTWFPPVKLNSYQWTLNNSDIISAEGTIEHKQTVTLNKVDSHCKIYPKNHEGFNECFKRLMVQRILNKDFNCSVVGIEIFLSNLTLPECEDQASAERTISFFGYLDQIQEKWQDVCPVPCLQTYYKLKTLDYHKNIIVTSKFDVPAFFLRLRYDKFVIETDAEKLYYDFVDILTQVGGNLGLFLGFSCLSFLLAFVRLAKKLFKYRHLNK